MSNTFPGKGPLAAFPFQALFMQPTAAEMEKPFPCTLPVLLCKSITSRMGIAIVFVVLLFPLGLYAQTSYVKRVNCGQLAGDVIYQGTTYGPDDPIGQGFEYTGDALTTGGHSNFTLAGPYSPVRYTKNPFMRYEFPVLNGRYRVVLHFAEPFHGPALSGSASDTRRFNVDIENGQYAVNDLVVYEMAGNVANGIHIIDREVDVTDGKVTITLSDGSGNDPIINAIEVLGTDNTDTQPPTAPTLSTTAKTDTSVDLVWSGAADNVGVTGYKVFRDGALEATLGSVGSYQATGLAPSTAYSFTVRALDAAGNESLDSNALSITTDPSTGGGDGNWSLSGSNVFYNGGNVGIGTSNPGTYKLAVNGNIHAKEVKVDLIGWADYVFKKGYDLPSLEEVERHILEKGHLINIPSAAEVEAEGIELGR